jgi:outer membrane protein assembly factor BamB
VFDSNSQLVCLNKDTGALRWIKKLKREEDAVASVWYGQLLVKDHVLMVSPSGHLTYISVHDGKVKKIVKLLAEINVNPVVADGLLYVQSGDGMIAAYR